MVITNVLRGLLMLLLVAGCDNAVQEATLSHSQATTVGRLPPLTDNSNAFHISTPEGWGNAPMVGRMVWHVASNGGTELPDCSLVSTADPSFEVISIEDYISTQTEAKIIKISSMYMDDFTIGNWEPNFELAGQRALHFISTGTLEGDRMSGVTMQTIHSGKLFTFTCNATADEFLLIYADLLKISDTFAFTSEQ